MKIPPAFRSLLAACAFLYATLAFAQTATLTADSTTLAPDGGTVQLVAAVSYEATPGAIGWSIVLPEGWALASVGGGDVPAISAEPGAKGTVEFAYTTPPAGRAEFTLVVRYPAGAAGAKATSSVLVRTAGKLATLTPAPVAFRGK